MDDGESPVPPGIPGYLLDDQGVLRRPMNRFVNEGLIRDRQRRRSERMILGTRMDLLDSVRLT